jgi:hypothetical protein
MDTIIPPIYLGMNPLPLKGVKYAATTSLNGISVGGAQISNIDSGAAPNKIFGIGTAGISQTKSKRGRSPKAKVQVRAVSNKKGSNKVSKRVLPRRVNGKFVKG